MRGSPPLSLTPSLSEAPCRSRFVRSALAVFLASLLVACGGGGASLTPPETAPRADFAPLNHGDRWVYRRQDGALEQRAVVGTRTVSGRTATVVATTDLTLDEVEESFFVKTASALIELPDNADPIGMGDYDLFLGLQLQRGDGRPDVAMNGPVLLRNLGDAPPRSSPPLAPAMSPPAAPAPLSCRSVRCRPPPAAAARWH